MYKLLSKYKETTELANFLEEQEEDSPNLNDLSYSAEDSDGEKYFCNLCNKYM